MLEGSNEQTGAEGEYTGEPTDGPEDYHGEDDIGYDLDDEAVADPQAGVSNSPLGKRSFDEHAEAGEFVDEPELKKLRSD